MDYIKTKSEAGKKKEKGIKRATEIEKAVAKLRSQVSDFEFFPRLYDDESLASLQ